jgi:peptide/histidine transporter 3/4
MSYFNRWNSALCSGVLLGVTFVLYVQERVGWGAATILVTIPARGGSESCDDH